LPSTGTINTKEKRLDTISSLNFTHSEGSNTNHAIKVFALTTCGFCERAMTFLKKEEYDFEFIFLDKIDPATKREVKKEMKEKYGKVPLYPVLLVDEQKMLSGFTEARWKEVLS
jgi:glutaredoxin-like protein NrdH